MAEPGQLRKQNNRLFLVLSHWCDDTGEGEGTHWIVAMISQKDQPVHHEDVLLSTGHVAEAWTICTLTNSGIDTYSQHSGDVTEEDRRSVCEVFFSKIGEDCRSPRTKEMQGPETPDMTEKEWIQYAESELEALKFIELADPFQQRFWGLIPIRKYRKHKHKELPRMKKHIAHRRWEDDEYDGQH